MLPRTDVQRAVLFRPACSRAGLSLVDSWGGSNRKPNGAPPLPQLQTEHPAIWAKLEANLKLLEGNYKDILDIDFAIQEGKVFVYSCQTARRTGQASAWCLGRGALFPLSAL